LPPPSNASSPCRTELRASRGLALSLLALGVLAALAVGLSGLNLSLVLTVAGGALAWSLRLALREWRRPPQVLLLQEPGQPSTLIEHEVERIVNLQRIGFRGPFVQLQWKDVHGRTTHRLLWPDALPESHRRALRRRFGAGGAGELAGMAG
jgi:toxin CptA